MPLRRCFPCLFLLLSSTLPLAAQAGGQARLRFQTSNGQEQSDFGTCVDRAGDVNGDFFEDLIIGAPRENVGSQTNLGAVYILAGPSFQLLRRIDGIQAGKRFGAAVSGAGDLNQDGFDEVVVGAPDARRARVFDGLSGNLLYTLEYPGIESMFGRSVSEAGDVNGDNIPDVAVAGDVVIGVFSGADGTLIRRFEASTIGHPIGHVVKSAGDFNQDGYDDIVGTKTNPIKGGDIYVLSGLDGSELAHFKGGSLLSNFGTAVDVAEDIDFDGVPEILVSNTSTGADSYVELISGATGFRLFHWVPPGGIIIDYGYGETVAVLEDVDGDQVQDYMVGAPRYSSNGAVFLYSGRTGKALHILEEAANTFGSSVASIGDLTGDGLSEFVTGAPNAETVFVHDFRPLLYSDAPCISSSSGGTVRFHIDFPQSEADMNYALLASVYGTGPTSILGLQVPLSDGPIFQLCLNGNSPGELKNAYGRLNHKGNALARLVVQPDQLSKMVDHSLYFAAISYSSQPNQPRLSSIARAICVNP